MCRMFGMLDSMRRVIHERGHQGFDFGAYTIPHTGVFFPCFPSSPLSFPPLPFLFLLEGEFCISGGIPPARCLELTLPSLIPYSMEFPVAMRWFRLRLRTAIPIYFTLLTAIAFFRKPLYALTFSLQTHYSYNCVFRSLYRMDSTSEHERIWRCIWRCINSWRLSGSMCQQIRL